MIDIFIERDINVKIIYREVYMRKSEMRRIFIC